jgi:coatomer subunit beta'
MMDNLGHLLSVDTNTNKPWVAIRRSGQAQKATIVDYVTQEQTGTLEATTWGAASSPKFFAQEEWIMAPSPDDDGHIHIYNYKMENIDAFKVGRYAVTNLAVHPTKLSLLSMCWASNEIKLWVCDDGWKLSQTFIPEKTVNKVVFNPKDTDINGFAISCDDHTVELWDLDSSECSCTLSGHQDELNCLDFFTREDQQHYLITGSNDKTAKIWDIQTMTCVHTLEGFMSPVMCVFGHPKLPVLITGTEDGIIHLWSSTDFRLKKILNMGSCGEVLSLSLACPVESRRVVIGQSGAIIIMDFGEEGEWEEREDEREGQH